jgi:hypothetical protein
MNIPIVKKRHPATVMKGMPASAIRDAYEFIPADELENRAKEFYIRMRDGAESIYHGEIMARISRLAKVGKIDKISESIFDEIYLDSPLQFIIDRSRKDPDYREHLGFILDLAGS